MKTYFYQLEKYKPVSENRLENWCVGLLAGIIVLFCLLG